MGLPHALILYQKQFHKRVAVDPAIQPHRCSSSRQPPLLSKQWQFLKRHLESETVSINFPYSATLKFISLFTLNGSLLNWYMIL